ncbi:MAG: cell division protein FtsL [Zoogloeaceae bacterium]|nr:cell division protein FtsL [Zoogloeaceae bacterium]
MLRLNLPLLLIAICCALGSVTAQHEARKLYQAMETEQERARQLEVEYEQARLELSRWAAHSRIEKTAREHLRMDPPPPGAQSYPEANPVRTEGRL